ncbi:MAG: hypothetical protein VW338_04975 [Rhodospirillaceae bacterium]
MNTSVVFAFFLFNWELSASYWGNDLGALVRVRVGPLYFAVER